MGEQGEMKIGDLAQSWCVGEQGVLKIGDLAHI